MAYTNLNLNICPRDNIDETRRREYQSNRIGSQGKVPGKKEGSVLMQELNQRRTENKKLTEMLFFLSENYNSLQGQLMDFKLEDDQSKLKKRKAEGENCGVLGINGNSESSSCSDGGSWKMPREIKTNVSRVHVKTDPSDTSLIVKDGYRWRKYGQKVTRDNPSPRAYYKCSVAPTCPAKKKVQRSVEDPWVVVAIYEGEHHHHHPCQADRLPLGLNQGVISSPKSTISSSPSPILDSMQPGLCIDARRPNLGIDVPAFQELLVKKMANSLTRNHSFTTALAAAISTRILDHDLLESRENTS
ncbi:probable WRKY transcription factor 40 [Actinidia eriantha]|uniref:probable WRKY transcription factor 40 n=1 Tax=Actinidia eriantha TaxID=165200 RepID=UPI002591077E|nr:probable WRKY transcription factor 40 [Actinidia eriantha]